VTVAGGDTTVDAGSPATGTITISIDAEVDTNADVETITVSGCGVTDETIVDSDTTAAGIQFSVDIPANQPAGQCTLTFTTTFSDGVVETDTLVITVGNVQVAPDTPTVTVTPDTPDTATATVNPQSGGDSTADDDRTFSIAGLLTGETYRITLVACDNVQGSGSSATFLAEADTANTGSGFSANTGMPTTDIVSVNGVATVETEANVLVDGLQVGTTTFVAIDATATFVIDGDTAECVVPVVYFDSTTADPSQGGTTTRLEVAGPAGSFGAPVEEFDIGGRLTFS
jgi:hypothetical protein